MSSLWAARARPGARFIGATLLFFLDTFACGSAAAVADCGRAITPSSLLIFTDRERATDAQIFTGQRSAGAGMAALTGGVLQPPLSENSLTLCRNAQSLVTALAKRFDRKRGRQALIYVHGYFTTFRSAMEAASTLQQALQFPGPVIAFSWPARVTSRLAYADDEKNAGWAMHHFQLLLDRIEMTYPGIPLSFAVHSLGGRFMTRGIAEIAAHGCKRCFGRGVAFAPDENVDAFRDALRKLGLCRGKPPSAPLHAAPVTIYVSNRDRAVRASQHYHGDNQRAGQAARYMLICGGVDTIDVSYFKSSDPFGHSYQLDPPIAADARAALAGVRPTAPVRKLRQVSRSGGVYYELGR